MLGCSRVAGWGGLSRASRSFVSFGQVVEGLSECGADALPGGRDRCGPSPSGIDAESQLAGAAGDAGRHVQDPVAEGSDLAAGQLGVVGESDELSPRHQIGCGQDDFQPSGIDVKRLTRQITQPGGLQSVAAVRRVVAETPAPPGVKAYVAGNTVLSADTQVVGHKSMATMALVSIVVIVVLLLLVYRSVVTMILCLVVIGIELFAASGVAATAGNLGIIGLTPYAASMITMLSIAAGTDDMIFLLGRYHEARSVGRTPPTSSSPKPEPT
jgi:hypothetical protein